MIKRFWLIALGGLGVLIFAGMIGVGLFGNPEALQEFDVKDELWVIRSGAYLLIVAFWWLFAPILIVPRKPDQDEQQNSDLVSKRAEVRGMTWKVAAFLVVFEIIAVQQMGMA